MTQWDTKADGGGESSVWATPQVPKKRRRRRIILWTAGTILALLALLLILTPTIASRVAPGYVERAVNDAIPGRLDLRGLRLGWSGPTVVGPATLLDDQGKRVGEVTIDVPAGLWRIVSERWWSRKRLDLGAIVIDADLDVVRAPDGATNLERALGLDKPGKPSKPSKPGKPGKAEMPPGGIEEIRAIVRLADVDATFTDLSAPTGSPAAQGLAMRGLAGDIALDYAASRRGLDVTLRTDLKGAIRSGPGTGQSVEKQTILVDAEARLGKDFDVQNADVTAKVSNLSVALADLLGGFGGELTASIGPRADLSLVAAGNAEKASAVVDLTAEGAGANLKLDYDGARLALQEPGRVWVRTLRFIAGLNAARPALERAAELIRLDSAPGVNISIDSLHVPVTTAQLTGAGDLTQRLDLRGTQLGVTVTTDPIAGRVAMIPSQPATSPAASPDGPEKRWDPFQVQPLRLTLATDDLAQGIRLTSGASATIADQDAGRLGVDVLAAGLLDEQGRPITGGLPRLSGEVRLTEIATQLVQPILEGMGLPVKLDEDVGPRLDVVLTAATTQAATSAPGADGLEALPPTDITAHLASRNINASAALRVERGVAQASGDGIVLRIASAGPLVRRVMASSPDLHIGGAAGVEVAVPQLRVPLDGSAGSLDGVIGDVRAQLTDLAIGLGDQRIDLPRATLAATLPPNDGPRATLDAQLAHAGTPFTATGDLALPRLRQRWPIADGEDPLPAALSWEPRGQLQIKGVPGSLAAFVPALAGEPAGPDDLQGHIAALVRSLIGRQVDVGVQLAPDAASAATGPASRLTASVYGGAAALDAAATLSPEAILLQRTIAVVKLDPRDIDPVLAAATPAPASPQPAHPHAPMRLAAPVTLRASVDPVTVPLQSGAAPAPDLSKVGEIVANITADDPVLIQNVAIGDKLETVGVGSVKVRATAPAGLLAADEPTRGAMKARAEITMALLRGIAQGGVVPQNLGNLVVNASIPINPAAAPISIQSEINSINTAGLDALLGQDGTLAGAIGPDAILRAYIAHQTGHPLIFDTQLASQRLALGWVRLAVDDKAGVARLREPAEVTWTPDVAWLNRVAFAPASSPAPAQGGQVISAPAAAQPAEGSARLLELAPIKVSIENIRIALPRSDERSGRPVQGPLKPGVFALAATARAPRAVIDSGAGRPPVAIEGVSLTASNVPQASDIQFTLNIAQVAGAGQQAAQGQGISGRLANLADSAGVPAPDAAELTARGGVVGFPTPLLDALAQQGGLLTEALGPAVSLDLQAERLSKRGGTLRAEARSERANAVIAGRIEDGTFIQTGPTQATLLVITPQLVHELGGSLPVIGTLEKTRQDEPGIVRLENVTAPLDGDLRKLNGRVTVDPGVVNFTTQGGFASLLKIANQRQQGQLGRRLEPFVVNIARGVASYDRFRLNLGEFTVETSGQVDLVSRQIDVITYVPFFALTDEIAGALSTNLAGVLSGLPGGIDRATLVPLRTRGPLSGPETKVDTDLFIKQFGESLLNTPGRIIDDVLRGRIEDLIRPRPSK